MSHLRTVSQVGTRCEVVCLDDLEHPDREGDELIGQIVRVVRTFVPDGICLSEDDPLIECVVEHSGEHIAFYQENLRAVDE